MNVAAMLDAAASRWGDRTALVDERGAVGFAALADQARALAERLTQAGVRPGQGVGLVARNGREFVVGAFALLRTGAVVMPLFHQLRRAELLGQVADAGLHAVVDDGSIAPLVDGARPLDAEDGAWRLGVTARGQAEPDAPFVPHLPDAAFVRYTSGTTGRSKGVVLGHAAVWARTEAAAAALRLSEDDAVLWVLPMAYHFVVSVVAYVRYGATILVCPDVFAGSILDLGERHGGTLLYASPVHYRMLASEASGRALPRLRCAISTSSGLPADVGPAVAARLGVPVRQVYGIIECGLPLGDLDGDDVRPTSVGRALPGFEVAVLDDEGRPLPTGATGHLGLRGPGLFDGYLAPACRAEDVLREGWFMTGDLAWVDETGRVTVCGRSKSMINVAGHKVFPEEVEGVLDSLPGVAASRVIGVAHPILGEVVHAQIEAAPGSAVDLDALRRACQERLSAHKVPQRLELVASLPRTRTGKVQRHGG